MKWLRDGSKMRGHTPGLLVCGMSTKKRGLSITTMIMTMGPSMSLMKRDLMANMIPWREADTTIRRAEAIMGGVMKIITTKQREEAKLMTGNLRDPR